MKWNNFGGTKMLAVATSNIVLTLALTLTGCGEVTNTTTPQIEQPSIIETSVHGTVHVKPVIEDVVTLPGLARAQQGTLAHPNGSYYFTENKGGGSTRQSTIYRVNSDLTEVVASFTITAADLPLWDDVSGNYHSHFGQAAYNNDDGFIYVTMMDTSSSKSGLLKFSSDTQFQGFHDWSYISPYFDSIAFQDDLLWFDYGVTSHISFSKFKQGNNTSNLDWTKYDVDHSLMNTSQGLQVRDNKLYYVPENDPNTNQTLVNYRGVAVFDIPSMNARANINVSDAKSYPQKLYRFQIPTGAADHEAMDFVLGTTNQLYISTANDGGDKLYRVRFE